MQNYVNRIVTHVVSSTISKDDSGMMFHKTIGINVGMYIRNVNTFSTNRNGLQKNSVKGKKFQNT